MVDTESISFSCVNSFDACALSCLFPFSASSSARLLCISFVRLADCSVYTTRLPVKSFHSFTSAKDSRPAKKFSLLLIRILDQEIPSVHTNPNHHAFILPMQDYCSSTRHLRHPHRSTVRQWHHYALLKFIFSLYLLAYNI